jgi:hypothetical protein
MRLAASRTELLQRRDGRDGVQRVQRVL